MRRVDTIGPNLADMLRHQRKQLAKVSNEVEQQTDAVDAARQDLISKLFELEGGIASARALLASNGVMIKFAVKSRGSKKAKATPEPDARASLAGSNPAPAIASPHNGATTHEEVVPELIEQPSIN
jgi:hypothetical protein